MATPHQNLGQRILLAVALAGAGQTQALPTADLTAGRPA